MAESETDEEVDVLSNSDQNGFAMYGQNMTIQQRTTNSHGLSGGWQQERGNAGLNSSKDNYDSDTEESSSSSEAETESDDDDDDDDEEEEETPASTPAPVHHIRDIHPIKPSEEDQPELEQEEEEEEEDREEEVPSPDATSASSPGLNKQGKERFWEDCPEVYGIRRSGRARKEPERFNVIEESNDDDEVLGPVKKKKKTKNATRANRISSSEDWSVQASHNDSSSDSSDSYTPEVSRPRPRPQQRARARVAPPQAIGNLMPSRSVFGTKSKPKPTPPKRNKVKQPVSESESDTDDDVSRASSLRKAANNITSYKEESDDETDSEDVIEPTGDWQEEYVEDDREMIERILDSRVGRLDETGAKTTFYAYEKEELMLRGPPDPKNEETERQYLIKWKGWSHLHNTWESERTLVEQKVKGMKKLENFAKREQDINDWKKLASPEDIEYFEVQQEMNYELIEEYRQVERIISHTTVTNADELGNSYNQVDYLCKWFGLPYGESTWEDGSLISKYFQEHIDTYLNRERNDKIPNKSAKVLRQRPKFSLIKKQPVYIGPGGTLCLRDYQLDGLNWLVNAWCRGNSTILADEMGLGKTIQVISFLNYLFHTHSLYGPFLVVVPLSTLAAWQREFAAWAPQINVVVYLGDVTSRTKIREHEFYHKNKKLKINALLTTYEILLKDKHILCTLNWTNLVVDEAHRLKNDDSLLYKSLQEFHTNHRLLVTGTPLQNSLKELWALLQFLMPDRFYSWEEFELAHSTQEQRDTGFAGLHKELEPFLLRRVKKDVEKSLPAKVEQILRVEMSSIQKQYYRWILTKNFTALNKGMKGNMNSFLNIVMELKKCCNHASLIRPVDAQMAGLDPLQSLIRGSGKLFLLDKLLVRLKETGHRVLIFSQMVRMLDLLADYLQSRRFLFQRLDGSIRGDVRKKALDHFNAEGSEDFCFLLSTRAGGLGINLATADTVIIFDSDWNPQNDLQAQARAHRIGQKNQVNIYRLVSKGSVEEDIIERAKRKMVLDHLIIQRMDTTGRKVLSKSTPASSSTPFNKDELASILKFGAEDLFKEGDGEQDSQLQEMDIDDILRRAETRDSEDQPQTIGDELLSQFKMANFAIDEEAINTPEPIAQLDSKAWEDIIPEDIRQKAVEEEEQKERLAMFLPPRSRKTVNKMNYDSDGDSTNRRKGRKKKSESEDEGSDGDDKDTKRKRGRPRTIKREDIDGFNDTEIRRFVKSYKKFGRPRTRLHAIAIDAELDDKPSEDIERLSSILHDGCQRAVLEYNEKLQEDPNFDGKKRGATLRIGNVTINAPSILKHEEELEPLASAIPADLNERKKYRLTFPAKSVHWGVPWDVSDDSMLLVGIHQYGMGSWEAIKADESLQLSTKILPPGNLKPQDKHLQTRAEYLIKLLKQVLVESKADELKKSSSAAKGKVKRLRKKVLKKNLGSANVSPSSSAVPSPRPISSPAVHQEVKEEEKPVESPKPSLPETPKKGRKKQVESTKKTKAKKTKPPKAEKVKKEKKEKVKEKEEPLKIEPVHLEESHPSPEDISMQYEETLKRTSESNDEHMTNDDTGGSDSMDKATFDSCKEKMRPVKKALKMLESPEDNVSDKDKVAQTRLCLFKIGDHIMEITSQYKDHDVSSEWRWNLWTFVSKFTSFEAKKLYRLYKHACKKREDEKPQQHQKERHQHKSNQSNKNGKVTTNHPGQRPHDLKRPYDSLSSSSVKIPKLDNSSRARFSGNSDGSHRRPRDGHDDRHRHHNRDRFSSHYEHSKSGVDRPSEPSRSHDKGVDRLTEHSRSYDKGGDRHSDHSRFHDKAGSDRLSEHTRPHDRGGIDRLSEHNRPHDRLSDYSRTKDSHSRSYDRSSDHYSRSSYDKRDYRDDHHRSRYHSYSHRTSSESSQCSPLDNVYSPRPPHDSSRKQYTESDKHTKERDNR